MDMAVLFNGQVSSRWSSSPRLGRFLQQIKDMGYADKYSARGEAIHLIGVAFSKVSRSIVEFEVEILQIG